MFIYGKRTSDVTVYASLAECRIGGFTRTNSIEGVQKITDLRGPECRIGGFTRTKIEGVQKITDLRGHHKWRSLYLF